MDVKAWRSRFAGLNAQGTNLGTNLGINLGLDRMRQVLGLLDHPETQLGTIIHVSGTNGKGGVIAALEAALIQAGISVQTYTSPYLWRFEENIRLNGQPIDPDLCADLFARLWDARTHVPPTWFEADTLVAFLAFAEHQAEVTLIECGMGGARDATAVVPPPLAAVLTNVGGDHAEFLGTDLHGVAREKAGIAKGAPLYVPDDFAFDVGAVIRVPCGKTPSLDLANAVLTDHFPAARPLSTPPTQVGRWYPDPGDATTFYDVGHNAHAARYLAQKLSREPGPYRLDVGVLRRKDLAAFLRPFAALKPAVVPVDLGPEAYGVSEIADAVQALGLRLWDGGTYGTRLVTGSHQTVAKLLHAGS